jgi:hypothetical protein
MTFILIFTHVVRPHTNRRIISDPQLENPVLSKQSLTKVIRDSSVGIATRYGLDGPGIEYRLWTRFSVPV